MLDWKCKMWKKGFSPSIYFWQSSSWSERWQTHECSCREPCLQKSFKIRDELLMQFCWKEEKDITNNTYFEVILPWVL